MKPTRLTPFVLAALGLLAAPVCAFAVELPGHYFHLMEAELKVLDGSKPNPGAMFAAAVLYGKKHPANPSFGDKKKLELALKLGDLLAESSENDKAENKQHYEWEIHFWLDTYRLLEKELGPDRRTRWRKEIEMITRWFAGEVAARIDFPRYQGPYIRTSTNHLAIFASTVYLAGRILPNKDWETLGARALHRLAAEEQTADGYWGEFTDNGPTTGYNYLTMNCVALYWEHSKDKAALEALRRATTFHKYFTWPDGTPVETINGRNRHWGVSPWGHFGFTHWPDGRRYAEFLAGFFSAPVGQAFQPDGQARKPDLRKAGLGSKTIGRLAQTALYYHEGPTDKTPQELPRFAHQMKVPAGIRKTGPWTVCLSGLIDAPIDSQFTLDRQGHLSIFHEKLGLIITGANSRNQPELATFLVKTKDRVTTIPLSSRLRISDDRDRLGLAYPTFFAEAEVPTPSDERMTFRFAITETGRGRLQEASLNLQLCLKVGEALETARSKVVLGEKRIELGPDEIGGWIRHRGWTLRVDPTARLVWPVLPFNPYRNGPETDMRHAVGVLTVPVQVQPPTEGALNWRRGGIAFALETSPAEKTPQEECGSAVSSETEEPAAKRKTDIAFKIIPGEENGSKAILEKRKADLLERRGGKLQSHDWWLWGLTPMDYDRDGDPDFLVTIHGPNHGVVLKHQFKENGTLTFLDVTKELGVDNLLPAATGRRTFVWDFDGDGWLDIVGIGSPHLLNQKGKKFLPLAKSGFSSFNPQAIVDLNGDGHPDFYNNAGQNGLWAPAKQTFELKSFTHPLEEKLPATVRTFWQDAKAKPANRFLRVKFLTDHDLDSDGTPEVIMTGYASYGGDVFARYFRKDKDATEEMGLPTEGVPILIRDLDGDGHVDLLIAAAASAGFYRNDGKGRFRLQPGPLTDQLKSRDPYLHRAEAVDFDNDGLLDLVVTKPRSGQTIIYANLGNGLFEPVHKLKGWDSDPVAICDLNDDGLVDVAIGGPGDQVTLLLNTTARPGRGCRLYVRMPAPNHYAVGAKLEMFRAGALSKPGARPFRIETAPPDASPVHIGLGKEQQFDLRITFPGQQPREWPNVEGRDRLQITPEGIK